jgi:hypothetical protein
LAGLSRTEREENGMVKVSIDGGRANFAVQGWDKLWALKTSLEIPLSHIRGARIDTESARGWFHGLRLPGTEIPGVLTAGTFLQRDGAVFFDVHDPDNTIVIELDHENYKRLVIEVEDPDATVTMIQSAL